MEKDLPCILILIWFPMKEQKDGYNIFLVLNCNWISNKHMFYFLILFGIISKLFMHSAGLISSF